MGKHRTQKSLAKPVWMPLKREHYRSRPAKTHKTVLYPSWLRSTLSRMGDLRSCPHSLSLDTDRWFNRCPEQFVLGFKNFDGNLFAELGHTLRYPTRWEPFYKNSDRVKDPSKASIGDLAKPFNMYDQKVKRKADKYQQHTRAWRYNLSNPEHAQAYCNLLHYSTAYAAGEADRSTFYDLYKLDIYDRKELARWPISGLMHYDPEDQLCKPVADGYEVLEVVAVPGERPSKPKILCYPRPNGSNEVRAKLYEHHVGQKREAAKNARKRAKLIDEFYKQCLGPLARLHTTNCQKRGCKHAEHDGSIDNCGITHVKHVVASVYKKAKKYHKQFKKLGTHPGSILLDKTVDLIRQAKEDTDQIEYIIDHVQKTEWFAPMLKPDFLYREGMVYHFGGKHKLECWNSMFDPKFIRPNCISAVILHPGFDEAIEMVRDIDEIKAEKLEDMRCKRKLPRYYYELAMGSDKAENNREKCFVGPFRKAIRKIQAYNDQCIQEYAAVAEKYQNLLIDEKQWDLEQELYDKRCSAVQELKRLELRVRRRGNNEKGIDVDAFYLSYNSELDIPLKAARGIGQRFPAFWASTFNLYKAQGNKPSNRFIGEQKRNYSEKALVGSKGRAKFWSSVRHLSDQKREKEYAHDGLITRNQTEYRQMRWDSDLVTKYLNPGKIAYLCKPQAEHGLFLLDWAQDVTRDSKDYMLRLALAQQGLLRWNPDWTVDREQAARDYKLIDQQALESLQQAAFLFALYTTWNMRRRGKSTGEPISFRRAGHFSARSVFKAGCISSRGPPRA